MRVHCIDNVGETCESVRQAQHRCHGDFRASAPNWKRISQWPAGYLCLRSLPVKPKLTFRFDSKFYFGSFRQTESSREIGPRVQFLGIYFFLLVQV